MLKTWLLVLAIMATGTTSASAASVAVSTANVNLRSGPGTNYPAVTVVPQGSRIVTQGCVADYA